MAAISLKSALRGIGIKDDYKRADAQVAVAAV